jgi:hypothetical protein
MKDNLLAKEVTQHTVIEPKQLLAAFKQLGINSLEDFVREASPLLSQSDVASLYASINAHNNAIPVTKEMLNRALMIESSGPHLHQPTRVPIRVGKTLYYPEDVDHFNGTPLYFYCDESTLEENILLAFTSLTDIRQTLKERNELDHDFEKKIGSNSVVLYHNVGGEPAWFYEHPNFGGNSLRLDYRHALPNLNEQTLYGWWIWRISWNEQISSLRTGTSPLICYENVYFGGQRYFVGRNTSIPWLGTLWNDKISSVIENFMW